jgi:hypothetical protein
MPNLTSLLLTIGKTSLIVWSFSLCVCIFFLLKDKKINSSLISMTILVLTGAIMWWYDPYLLALKKSIDPSYLPYIIFTWYMGFAAIYSISIYILYKIHITFTIRYSFISKMLILGYFVQAQIQLIRYSERLLLGFDSQYLKPFYQAGVPAVNIGMAVLSFCFVTAMAISRYRIKQEKGGLKWVL